MATFDNPGEVIEQRFRARLLNIVHEIREEAGGRTCGGCAHHSLDVCTKYASLFTGNALQADDRALACSGWEAS